MRRGLEAENILEVSDTLKIVESAPRKKVYKNDLGYTRPKTRTRSRSRKEK